MPLDLPFWLISWALGAELGVVGLRHGADDQASVPEDLVGSGERVAADQVDHGVDVLELLFEPLRPVVDGFLGAEALEVGDVQGGGSREHAGLPRPGQLHREGSHAAGAAVDQEPEILVRLDDLEDQLVGRRRSRRPCPRP